MGSGQLRDLQIYAWFCFYKNIFTKQVLKTDAHEINKTKATSPDKTDFVDGLQGRPVMDIDK